MTQDKPANIAASVRQRLLNISRETGDDPNHLLTRYATERLLYRLSVSQHAGDFVLKGAMLFMAWTGQLYRPTADVDFLGYGEDSSDRLVDVFRSVCRVQVEPDGLSFNADSVTASRIREEQEYQGQRVTLSALLGKALVHVQVDVGFGDVVTPGPVKILYPTLLDLPAPSVRACPPETVVAEKSQAMVMLGIANSRMKDFYDLWVLSRDFPFEGSTLVQAIQATFKRRLTDIPAKPPVALTEEFAKDAAKVAQWKAFVRRSRLERAAPALHDVLTCIREFLWPPMRAAHGDHLVPTTWPKGGPWT